MNRNVSASRKLLYALGSALSIIGVIVFFSGFLVVLSDVGNPSPPDMSFGHSSGFDPAASTMMVRFLGGMVLVFAGNACRNIGARGVAGSGVVLDPEQARRDLEPFSRQAGGMLNDLLDEANIRPG